MTANSNQSTAAKIDAVAELFGQSDLGRAFLDGLGQRQRDKDLDHIFKALDRLESRAGIARDEVPNEDMGGELQSMSHAIAQARSEIASIKPGDESTSHTMAATQELDAIVTATERATADILGAAERIQVATQAMREGGIDERICEVLDEQSANIFMACSFQDITGQRVQKAVNLLHYLEQRINAMVDHGAADGQSTDHAQGKESVQFDPADNRTGAHLLSGPSHEGEGVSQDEVDRLLNGDISVETMEGEAPAEELAPEIDAAGAISTAEVDPADEDFSKQAGETVNQDDIDALFG